MKYTVKYSTLFKKSYRKCMKRGCDEELVWKQNDKELILLLVDTGTHQDFFGW